MIQKKGEMGEKWSFRSSVTNTGYLSSNLSCLTWEGGNRLRELIRNRRKVRTLIAESREGDTQTSTFKSQAGRIWFEMLEEDLSLWKCNGKGKRGTYSFIWTEGEKKAQERGTEKLHIETNSVWLDLSCSFSQGGMITQFVQWILKVWVNLLRTFSEISHKYTHLLSNIWSLLAYK